MEAFLYN